MNRPPVIVALDFAGLAEAEAMAARLDPRLCAVKVGKELFTRAGPGFVSGLVAGGFAVFLDLKFHDIPNTVARSCAAAAELGVWMINVHASGGGAMMRAARDALAGGRQRPLLIAVTVLTSMSDTDLVEVGVTGTTVAGQVMRLTTLARDSGLDGVVCSALEARSISTELGHGFVLVTPGIRPAGAAADDQKRITTPLEAVRAGSHYLVVGRPITQAADPLAVLAGIRAEMDSAGASRPGRI